MMADRWISVLLETSRCEFVINVVTLIDPNHSGLQLRGRAKPYWLSAQLVQVSTGPHSNMVETPSP
jgi:hypothetical protein